jgi:protein required for attachment to host cells
MNTTKWVLVANSSEAKVYESLGNFKNNFSLVTEFSSNTARLESHFLESDRLGRIQDRPHGHGDHATHHHAVEPRLDPQKKEKLQFADKIAEYINDITVRPNPPFAHLIVAASPEFLGELRQRFTKQTNNFVSEEVNKDLTNFSAQEIVEHLDK